MSRFDRRLGTGPYAKSNSSSTRRRYSPRPGTADCKLPTRNDVIMGKNSTNSKISNNSTVSNTINEVADKNERIMKKLQLTKNASERILLNHELRLNTVELSIDCLNNLNCDKSNNNSQFLEQENKIKTLEKTVSELSEKLILLTQMLETTKVNNTVQEDKGITMNISDIVEESVQKKVKNSSTIVEEVSEGPTFE